MSGLDPFYNTFNNPSNIVMAVFGDSTSKGDATVTNGGWPEQLRVLAASRWGRGGDGIHTMDRHWTLTSGGNAWTIATTSDAWDCAPLLGYFTTPAPATYFANGSAKIATWTKPSSLSPTAFTIYIVDGASAANFAYSLDGGTSWTNVSNTWNSDNKIVKLRINTAISSTLKIRAANAAGTAVNVYMAGVEPHTSAPGFVVHNVAGDGEFSGSIVRTTAGNWHAWLDVVQPPLCVYMLTNDDELWELFGDISAKIQTHLEALANVVTGYGGCLLFMNFFEQTTRSISIQAAIRVIVKTVAAEYGMPIIDFYDLVGDYAASVAAGYVDSGDIHPNNAGSVFIAQNVWAAIAKSGVGVKRRIS